MIRILFVATDAIDLNALLNSEAFYDLYLFEDEEGFISMVEVTLNSKVEIDLMLQHLFFFFKFLITDSRKRWGGGF
ncbi:hypothetical protein D770_04795 [Flammeovirgaceae bacterium 311]|nr:hypothetical protein D770_04795 [Flammeovirgaceae bacterium 311]